MMMNKTGYSVRWTEYALLSLRTSFYYWEKIYGRISAEKYVDKMFDNAQKIPINPFAYPECRELETQQHQYRYTLVDKYKIIFKIQDTDIFILDVFHSKRNPDLLKKLRNIDTE